MKRFRGGWGIGISMAVGILATLLWSRRDAELASAESIAAPAGTIAELPAQADGSRDTLLQNEALTASEAKTVESPSAPSQAIVTNDDSTYNRMRASAQADENERRALLDITKWHENFMLTPDDPAWARTTEQSLRGFFQKGYSGSNFTVTSVACRAEGCEVQTLNRRPVFNGLEVVPPMSEEFGREMTTVFELTHEPKPLGEGMIRLDNNVSTPVDDQMGQILWYRREPGPPPPPP